jgi:hypothetical protein
MENDRPPPLSYATPDPKTDGRTPPLFIFCIFSLIAGVGFSIGLTSGNDFPINFFGFLVGVISALAAIVLPILRQL